MRPSFFVNALAIKVYLTGDIKVWVLLYIKSYMILMPAPHINTC